MKNQSKLRRVRKHRRQFKMKQKSGGGVRAHVEQGGRSGRVRSKRLKQGSV